MHPASQKTHPITRGLPSLDLISFDTLQHDTAPWCRYVPIECQNNFTQNSMNLADLRRMMRIYFLLRQKSRQNARKNLSSPFLGCKRPFAFKSEQVKQACNKALYQNIWGATSEGQTGHRTVLHPGFCETSRSLQWWPSLACPAETARAHRLARRTRHVAAVNIWVNVAATNSTPLLSPIAALATSSQKHPKPWLLASCFFCLHPYQCCCVRHSAKKRPCSAA